MLDGEMDDSHQELPGPGHEGRELVSHNPERDGQGRDSEPADASPASPEPAAATPRTGNADVDAALARLPEFEALPTGEHVAVFEDVHRRLQDALSELDES